MAKGRPWTKEQEQTLIQLIRKGKAVDVIAKVLHKTEEAIYMKLKRLGLEVVVSEKNQLTTSSRSKTPTELPSIENVLKRLSRALKDLEKPGIEKNEIIRLRCFIQGVKIYKELFGDYVQYSEIEAELVELRRVYEELRKNAKDNAPKRNK